MVGPQPIGHDVDTIHTESVPSSYSGTLTPKSPRAPLPQPGRDGPRSVSPGLGCPLLPTLGPAPSLGMSLLLRPMAAGVWGGGESHLSVCGKKYLTSRLYKVCGEQECYEGLNSVSSSAKLSHINLSKQVFFAKNRFLSAIMQLSEEIMFLRSMSLL